MSFLPIVLPVAGRRCLVVGGGRVALQKVEVLQAAGAEVLVVAPVIDPALEGRPGVALRREPFDESHLDGAALVIAATDDPDLNHRVYGAAHARGLWVNVVDDPPWCDFIFPSILRRGMLTVAVSTGGASPALARMVREDLEGSFDRVYAAIVEEVGRLRRLVRAREPDPERRRTLNEALAAAARAMRVAPPADWRERLHAIADGTSAPTGSLTLVGAGPGDPELITLAGARALAEADVVLYDRLVHPALLAHAPRAERIAAGHRPGATGAPSHADKQARIHGLIEAHARLGRRIVRLKGGDPTVFGRAGEEIALARALGIPCRVIPGVTAATAAAAAAGMALTLRGVSSSVALVTGCGAEGAGADGPEWTALARAVQTIVVYMGAARIGRIARELIEGGRAPDEPAAIVRAATLPTQAVEFTTLRALAERPDRTAHPDTPEIILLGPAVAHARVAAEVVAERAGEGTP